MNTGPTIPYQLRPHKAIERNLFVTILKKLDRYSQIDLDEYRYVGFGAPFLEDFKIMHFEFGITKMDSIESDSFAFSRQKFNNPYYFLKLYNLTSTDYITSADFKQDKNQVVWLDYTSPGSFKEQLIDIELVAEKTANLDIVKFTFNASIQSFIDSHRLKFDPLEIEKIVDFLKKDPTYELYIPEAINLDNVKKDFSALLRAMATRAIRRGLKKKDIDLEFNHIAAFKYADGQKMTTLTGIISEKKEFQNILKESGLRNWDFYITEPKTELIIAHEISVPVMTVNERLEIDKKIPSTDLSELAKKLQFSYGSTSKEHLKLLTGYCKYYKYLPFYSKVTY